MSADIKNWHKTQAKNGHLPNPFCQQQMSTAAGYSYEYVNSSPADWMYSKNSEEKNAQILGPKTPLKKLGRRGSYPVDSVAEGLRMNNARLNAEINELHAAIHANVHYGRPFKPSHISMNKSQATDRSDNNVCGQLATIDNKNENDHDNDNDDNEANDETRERRRFTVADYMPGGRGFINNYHPTWKNECSWFLLMLFSYLAMCIPINVVVLVLVGWRPFFYRGMWIWSGPIFSTTILFGHISPFLKPGWRRRAYFCPNFPRRLRVYWATTALLSLLIITFLLGRHFFLGVPSQLTTSPEAIFPSTLGLDCGNVTLSFTAAANDEKVPSNQTLAADKVVASFADALGDDNEAKGKMHKCIKEILDDALGDDEAKKGEDKCTLVAIALVIFAAPIVGIVDFCFSSVFTKMRFN